MDLRQPSTRDYSSFPPRPGSQLSRSARGATRRVVNTTSDHRRADHHDPEGAGGRHAGEGAEPTARHHPADPVPLEVEVRRDGSERGQGGCVLRPCMDLGEGHRGVFQDQRSGLHHGGRSGLASIHEDRPSGAGRLGRLRSGRARTQLTGPRVPPLPARDGCRAHQPPHVTARALDTLKVFPCGAGQKARLGSR